MNTLNFNLCSRNLHSILEAWVPGSVNLPVLSESEDHYILQVNWTLLSRLHVSARYLLGLLPDGYVDDVSAGTLISAKRLNLPLYTFSFPWLLFFSIGRRTETIWFAWIWNRIIHPICWWDVLRQQMIGRYCDGRWNCVPFLLWEVLGIYTCYCPLAIPDPWLASDLSCASL